MRKLNILAMTLVVVLAAMPALASVQNVKISGSVDSSYLFRSNFDLGLSTNNIEDVKQSLFITQTTLQVDADLTDQVSTTVGLINERVWQQDAGNENSGLDLYLAYVTLREMLYSPLTVVVGRQVFSYGNSLIVDATGTNNAAGSDSGLSAVAEDLTKATSLDAIRLIFDYNPLTLEFVYAKIDEGTVISAFDNVTDDIDLYGINSTYELGDDMDTQVEAYFFARIDQTSNPGDADGSTKSNTLYVPGLRASANVLDGLNVQGEIAWQRGNFVATPTTSLFNNQKREALAVQITSNYQIPNDVLPDALEEYNPVLGYTFTKVSGDSNPLDVGSVTQASSNKNTAWDPFLENQGGGTIYNTLFNLTNLQIHSVSLTANPIEDVTTTVSWHGLRLDKKLDQSAGTSTITIQRPDVVSSSPQYTLAADNGKKWLGYEIDVDATYDYTEDVQIGASLGWFNPGKFFTSANRETATQAIVHGNVNF